MTIPIYQVDAFSDELFKGNPAAVCPLESWLPDELLQNIAAENNLAETAFFVPSGEDFELRWFTPAVEVALCGHATLASAHVLFQHLNYSPSQITFETRKSGVLKVSKKEGLIHMDFPVDVINEIAAPIDILDGLGIESAPCYKGSTDYLIVLNDQDQLDNLSPDFGSLSKVEARGIIVTAPGKEYDFVSRFFGPAVGINEDPVTGSAHTTLTPYWAQKLKKNILTAQQRSKRTGNLMCELQDARVLLTGKARTYLMGEINYN